MNQEPIGTIAQQLEREAQKNQSAAILKDMYRGAIGVACRTPLVQRVMSQKRQAEMESLNACRLGELASLLDKHPDIARILDLLEDVRA